MQVKAAKGLKVPMEDKPNSYIDDENEVTVEATTYYMRRIADGDLIEVEEKAKGAK